MKKHKLIIHKLPAPYKVFRIFSLIMTEKCLRSNARDHQHNHLKEWKKAPEIHVQDWFDRIEEAVANTNKLPSDNEITINSANVNLIFFDGLPERWRTAHDTHIVQSHKNCTKSKLVNYFKKQKTAWK